jgi:hypothetical protein
VLRCLARGTGVEPQSELGRELADRERAAVRWLEQRGGWSDPPRRARDWGQVALCAFALTRARALGGPASLNGFDVLERAAQEFVGHQRDDGLFQLGGARYVDEPLGLAVLAALRGPAARERRPRRSPLGYDDFELVASGHLDVRLSLGEWAPKIEREFEDRRLPVKLIEFFGVAANRTRDAVSIARVRGGDLTLDDIRRTTLDVVLPMRGRWQVRARVVLEPQSPDSGANGEGRVLLSGWLTLRAERPTTEEQLAEVRGDGVLPFPTRGITVETSSKFDGWPSERAVDRHLATGWACKDSDREPWIRITLTKPLKALGLRLAHAVPSGDGEQWPRATKIELAINERERWTLDVDAEPTQLLRHEFGRELSVKSIEIRVLDKFRPYASEFVGFSEIDLLAPAK